MKKNGTLILLLAALALCVSAIVITVCKMNKNTQKAGDSSPVLTADPGTGTPLGHGIEARRLFSYTGAYVQDGSDDAVSDVAAVTIYNGGPEYVQLLEFSVTDEKGKTFTFSGTTLFPGETMQLLEKDRRQGPGKRIASGTMGTFAPFAEAPSMMTDRIRLILSAPAGRLQAENISEAPIAAGKIFYQQMENNVIMGGITYSLTLPELQPGETTGLSPTHFNESSVLRFVTLKEPG